MGQHDIVNAWLSSPTARYPHGSLGSSTHAGSLHALVKRSSTSAPVQVNLSLPFQKVFEDRVPRVIDIDGDGRDEVLLIESELLQGSRLVVMGIDWNDKGDPALAVRAHGPSTGSTFRWLNPVAVADFDGDGQADIASVTTPHIGGTLYLYRYRPPALVPYASMMDVSNHRMGALEQRMAVALRTSKGVRPAIVLPDMTRKALHALRWTAKVPSGATAARADQKKDPREGQWEGHWEELADLHPLPASVERIVPAGRDHPDQACMALADGSIWKVTLSD